MRTTLTDLTSLNLSAESSALILEKSGVLNTSLVFLQSLGSSAASFNDFETHRTEQRSVVLRCLKMRNWISGGNPDNPDDLDLDLKNIECDGTCRGADGFLSFLVSGCLVPGLGLVTSPLVAAPVVESGFLTSA